MQGFQPHTFSLNNFTGPLDLLLYLVQKCEIDIGSIFVQQITSQYLEYLNSLQDTRVDAGAEFVVNTASLILLKSRALLPSNERPIAEEEAIDPRFDMMCQVADYCRFKQAAKNLSVRESQQQGYFFRGHAETFEVERKSGVQHLSLEELAGLLENALKRAAVRQPKIIREEEWRVADAIVFIKEELQQHSHLLFEAVFSGERCREELIVLFLAVLELMKQSEIAVVEDQATKEVRIIPKSSAQGEHHA
jgi:segregation and condensation protein A